jgi:hypothetical protein
MIRNIVENHLIPKQDYVYGFADLQGLLPNKYSDYSFGISIGKRLDDKIINNLIDGPVYMSISITITLIIRNLQSCQKKFKKIF